VSPLYGFDSAHVNIAGSISSHVNQWLKITRDPWIIAMVQGVSIPLDFLPCQDWVPFPYRLSVSERPIMDREVQKLLDKGVVEEVEHEEGEFISSVFLRPKPNGSHRLILDLTRMNENVEYQHFKMTSLQTAIDMLRPGAYMGSVDLRDAYYSLRIKPEDRKYLRFVWNDTLYEFVGMPNGLSCAPRVFTKVLTPVYANLREKGHECFPYIDDSFIIADTYDKCQDTIDQLVQSFIALGFTVNAEKSVLVPQQKIVFLGFWLDSEEMSVRPTVEKVEKFERASGELLDKDSPTIREVAGLVGLMTAYAAGVDYGGAHIKGLEIEKNAALAESRGSYDAPTKVGYMGLQDIAWWRRTLPSASKKIKLGGPDLEIFSDASDLGWGAHRGKFTAGGRWIGKELDCHTNIQELMGVHNALLALVPERDVLVKANTDNTTALAYIRHMGGTKSLECNRVAGEIWDWCESRSIKLLVAHVPGVENEVADYYSRHFEDDLEWELHPALFTRLCRTFGTPDIDLFASRINNKLDTFVAWRHEPYAWKVDAMSIDWSTNHMYMFPPFSLITKVVQKIIHDRARATLVVPNWPGQPWYGRIASATKRKIHFRRKKGNLIPHGEPNNKERLSKIPLLACHFSWVKN
jgi:hypothetical protein